MNIVEEIEKRMSNITILSVLLIQEKRFGMITAVEKEGRYVLKMRLATTMIVKMNKKWKDVYRQWQMESESNTNQSKYKHHFKTYLYYKFK